MTYSEQSKQNKLSATLKDFGIDENSNYNFKRTAELDKLFCSLTIYTPTNQSHYGEKFDLYTKLNNRTTEAFLKKLFNGVGVNNVYLYQTFSDRTRNKHDWYVDVIKDSGTMLCLRCDNGVVKSLYMAVRNAIAHGNIIQKNGFSILYSVSDNEKEYSSEVTFFLKITKLSNLMALIKTLEHYR